MVGFLQIWRSITHPILNVASFKQQPRNKRALLLSLTVCCCLSTCASTADERRRLQKTTAESKIKLTGEGKVEMEWVWGKAEANERWKFKSWHVKDETLMGIVEREANAGCTNTEIYCGSWRVHGKPPELHHIFVHVTGRLMRLPQSFGVWQLVLWSDQLLALCVVNV